MTDSCSLSIGSGQFVVSIGVGVSLVEENRELYDILLCLPITKIKRLVNF